MIFLFIYSEICVIWLISQYCCLEPFQFFFIYVLTSNNSTRLHGFGASQVFICMTICAYKFSGSTLLHHCNNNLLDDHFVSVNQAIDLLRSVLLYWWLSYFTQNPQQVFFFWPLGSREVGTFVSLTNSSRVFHSSIDILNQIMIFLLWKCIIDLSPSVLVELNS